jgi:hypothetical protein
MIPSASWGIVFHYPGYSTYYGAFCLHVVSSFSYIPVICLKLVLFLIPLQFVHLFFNQFKTNAQIAKEIKFVIAVYQTQ